MDALMKVEELEAREYDALQGEKSSRIQTRNQVWSLFFALLSGVVFASLQPGALSWAILVYPLATMFLAQYAGHNELIIDRIKDYLHQLEGKHHYEGYEHFNRAILKGSGAHLSALAGAILSTQVLASIVGAARLALDHQIIACIAAAIIEAVLILVTASHLRDN